MLRIWVTRQIAIGLSVAQNVCRVASESVMARLYWVLIGSRSAVCVCFVRMFGSSYAVRTVGKWHHFEIKFPTFTLAFLIIPC